MDKVETFELPTPRLEKSPFKLIAGLGGRFTQDSIEGIPDLWIALMTHVDKIPDRAGDHFYGVCCNADGKGGFEYIAGVEILKLDDLPQFYRWIELPELEYAVFEHRGGLDSLKQTYQAISNDWLPQSGRKAADAPEFERYSEDYDPQAGIGVLEVWLALEKSV